MGGRLISSDIELTFQTDLGFRYRIKQTNKQINPISKVHGKPNPQEVVHHGERCRPAPRPDCKGESAPL